MNNTRREFLSMLAGSLAAVPMAISRSGTSAADTSPETQGDRPAADSLDARLRRLHTKTGTKIVCIETFTRGSDLSIVRIRTDDGKEGFGQISTFDADLSATILHRKIARHVLGADRLTSMPLPTAALRRTTNILGPSSAEL